MNNHALRLCVWVARKTVPGENCDSAAAFFSDFLKDRVFRDFHRIFTANSPQIMPYYAAFFPAFFAIFFCNFPRGQVKEAAPY